MNKDYRLARKGAPTGFGHGRRHSCLGYVLKLCMLHLFSIHIHERECSPYACSDSFTVWATAVVYSVVHVPVIPSSGVTFMINIDRENWNIFVHVKTQACTVLNIICKSDMRK